MSWSSGWPFSSRSAKDWGKKKSFSRKEGSSFNEYFFKNRSYGKVGFLFSLVPGLGFLVFSTKVVGLVPAEAYQRWFFAADWTQLFAGNVQVGLTDWSQVLFTYKYAMMQICQVALDHANIAGFQSSPPGVIMDNCHLHIFFFRSWCCKCRSSRIESKNAPIVRGELADTSSPYLVLGQQLTFWQAEVPPSPSKPIKNAIVHKKLGTDIHTLRDEDFPMEQKGMAIMAQKTNPGYKNFTSALFRASTAAIIHRL